MVELPRVQLVELEETDSTNLALKRLAADGWPPYTVVTARRQTAGYGQRGRAWSSAGGGLYMSMLLPVPARPTQLPFVLGLGCHDALSRWSDEVQLKWVNDLVARGRKLGGLLVELGREGAIAGIGLNLQTPALPEAIGLAELTSAPPDLATLRDEVIACVRTRVAAWQQLGFATTKATWIAHSVTMGNRVRVTGVEPGLEGTAESLGPDGQLLLRQDDGRLLEVVTGTLRTADGRYC